MINKQETGIVKWFSREKGFGFIIPDSGTITQGDEIFVHYSAIADQDGYRNLIEGDKVRFDLVDRGKGPQAQNVHRLHTNQTASDLAPSPSGRGLG